MYTALYAPEATLSPGNHRPRPEAVGRANRPLRGVSRPGRTRAVPRPGGRRRRRSARAADRPRRRPGGPDRRGREPRSLPLRRAQGRRLRIVYVDTGALIALVWSRDRDHERV